MAIETIAYNAPIPFDTFAGHGNAVLKFYSSYLVSFKKIPGRVNEEAKYFYSESCQVTMPDNELIPKRDAFWEIMTTQYDQFPKVEREILSFILLSDQAADTHEIHMRCMLCLYPALDREPFRVPQAFVYEVGKADPGSGELEYQFKRLWNAYDRNSIQKAFDATKGSKVGLWTP